MDAGPLVTVLMNGILANRTDKAENRTKVSGARTLEG
jgi:hypothetical protein